MISDSELSHLLRHQGAVFEGAQGVLLDQQHGFFPHCTRSNTTFENPLRLLEEAEFNGPVTRIGLLRAYGTRHGEGPFISESSELDVAPCHNGVNPWQGRFRTGWFDAVAARYALKAVGGVDVLAVTNLDRLVHVPEIKVATRYENADPRYFSGRDIHILQGASLEELSRRTSSMVSIVPRYERFAGLRRGEDGEQYLRSLEGLLGHPIGAYSTSPGHRKIYRAV